MHNRRALPAIALLIFIHLCFGLNMLLTVPPWEAYDEPGHFGYAVSIAARGTLPQEDDTEPNPERIQPPLYYLSLATFLRLSGSDLSGFHFPEQNPQFYFNDHQIAYALHPALTVQDRQLEVILIASRVVSLLISLVGIPFTYLAARRLWPGDLGLQLAATAIFALWPQLLFNGSMVSNDGATAVIGAAVTWLLLRFAARPSSRRGLAILVLIIAGVGIKLTLLALIIGLLAAALLSASLRLIGIISVVGSLTVIGAIVILQAFPSILLPFFRPDATGQVGLSALWKYFGDPETPLFALKTLHNALNTAFGVFGWGHLPLPDPIQQAWIASFILACVGLSIVILRRQH